jgi:hypothetical protein
MCPVRQTKNPLRLSTITASGWPVVSSFWYLYDKGAFCCATLQSARVATYLRREARYGFEGSAGQPPYCGVCGRALAKIDEDRGAAILERLLARYLGDGDKPLARVLLSRSGPEAAIRLEPQIIFTWNFTARMGGPSPQGTKICPG